VAEVVPAGWTSLDASTTHDFGTVASGHATYEWTFHNFQNTAIKVIKLVDADGDLVTTVDQTAKAGWTVKLFKGAVQVGSDQVTAADGSYTWTDLGPGSYNVAEVVPAGWTSLDASTTHDFGTVASGHATYEWTFHNFQNTEITVIKWNDVNGNGVRDLPDDTGIAGWHIYLLKWDGASYAALTDGLTTGAAGSITFSDLGPGTYKVVEEDRIDWVHTYPVGGANFYDGIALVSGTPVTEDFGNHQTLKFVKEFTGPGALAGYTAPIISTDHLSSYVSQLKTGPAIWWTVTYTVTNKDTIAHNYIVWDKWGGNLLVLGSAPKTFVKPTLTLQDGHSFAINYAGYSGYLSTTGLVFTSMSAEGIGTDHGTAHVTLHTGDQQQGTNPGGGKGTSKDGKSYDLDVRWEIGILDPGETATFTIIVAPGMNPGGQLEFTSKGISVINTGPVVRVYGDTYNKEDFMYTVPETNVLTVYVQVPMP
jgi:hypothetical protein